MNLHIISNSKESWSFFVYSVFYFSIKSIDSNCEKPRRADNKINNTIGVEKRLNIFKNMTRRRRLAQTTTPRVYKNVSGVNKKRWPARLENLTGARLISFATKRRRFKQNVTLSLRKTRISFSRQLYGVVISVISPVDI